MSNKAGQAKAFVLRELVSVLAGCGAVLLSAAPLLGRNPSASKATLCLANLRALTVAWQLYAADNSGKLVQNFHGGQAQGGAAAANSLNAPWAVGWLDWTTAPDNTNSLFIRSTHYARLTPYIAAQRNVHKCPSDQYLSSSQRLKHWQQRVRSVSMNITVGDGNAKAGPWDTIYTQAKSISSFVFPGPSESSLFLEEHPDSINDPAFFPPRASGWEDVPASFHENGCNISFADGHAETHLWRSSLRDRPVRFSLSGPPGGTNDFDVKWCNYHSQRSSAASF